MCVLLLVCSPAMTLRGNLAIIIDRNSDTILAEELKWLPAKVPPSNIPLIDLKE